MFVSKMLKEHFMDYESHTVTQPPLQQKLEILDRHLTKNTSNSGNGGNNMKSTTKAMTGNKRQTSTAATM